MPLSTPFVGCRRTCSCGAAETASRLVRCLSSRPPVPQLHTQAHTSRAGNTGFQSSSAKLWLNSVDLDPVRAEEVNPPHSPWVLLNGRFKIIFIQNPLLSALYILRQCSGGTLTLLIFFRKIPQNCQAYVAEIFHSSLDILSATYLSEIDLFRSGHEAITSQEIQPLVAFSTKLRLHQLNWLPLTGMETACII